MRDRETEKETKREREREMERGRDRNSETKRGRIPYLIVNSYSGQGDIEGEG